MIPTWTDDWRRPLQRDGPSGFDLACLRPLAASAATTRTVCSWPRQLDWPSEVGLDLPQYPLCCLCGTRCVPFLPKCFVLNKTLECLVPMVRSNFTTSDAIYTVQVGHIDPPYRVGPDVTGPTVRVIFHCGKDTCAQPNITRACTQISDAETLLDLIHYD